MTPILVVSTIQIITDRLDLRNFTITDAQGLLELLSTPRVNCFISDKITTLEEALSEVKKKSKDDAHIAVSLKEDKSLIGMLFYLFESPDTYSIGCNFKANYEGKGYAKESVNAFIQYLFTEKNARRVYAYVEEDNYRSQKLCEKLGMRKEGCFLEYISFTTYSNGVPKYENTLQYALLKKEWEARQKA